MKKTLRIGAVALTLAASTLPFTSTAHAAKEAAVVYPNGWTLVAIGYGLGFGFCTALAFGKQTAAAGPAIVGPKARLEAVKDCILPIRGINKWKGK